MSQVLQQTQSQTLIMAPQMRRSLEILQAATLDLRNVILEELQTNPTLEEEASSAINISLEAKTNRTDNAGSFDNESQDSEIEFSENFSALQKLDQDWRDHFSQENRIQTYTAQDAERREHFFDSFVSETSLQEHIMQQIQLSDCSKEIIKAMPYIIGSLDDRGFLNSKPEEIASFASIPTPVVKEAISLLKSLEPIGLGSQSLQECLLYQLEYNHQKDSLAFIIIRDHMDLLLRRRIPELAKKLNVDNEDIQDALQAITQLDPSPGRRFKEDTNRSIMADIIIEKDISNHWVVRLNNDYIPRLRINHTYKELLHKPSLSSQEKEYLKTKMQSGKFLINAIEQRQQTIEKIAQQLVVFQQDFLDYGINKLHPLTMHTIAQKIGVHETTVSRAIAGKYIQTPHGIFEMKFFFTSGYSLADGETVSNTSIKEEIAKIIQSENPQKPYSDQAIAEILKEQNIDIARRTVAKYREELKILPTHLRRVY